MNKVEMVKFMLDNGYYLQPGFTSEYLSFSYPGMVFPMVFTTWKEVQEWIEGVVID
jgi:hypothetical protein